MKLLDCITEVFRNGEKCFVDGLLALAKDDLDFREGDFREEGVSHLYEGEEVTDENNDYQDGDVVSVIDIDVLESVMYCLRG